MQIIQGQLHLWRVVTQVIGDAHALDARLRVGECVLTCGIGVEGGVNREHGFDRACIQTEFRDPRIGQHGDFFTWRIERGHARGGVRVGDIITVDRQRRRGNVHADAVVLCIDLQH